MFDRGVREGVAVNVSLLDGKNVKLPAAAAAAAEGGDGGGASKKKKVESQFF